MYPRSAPKYSGQMENKEKRKQLQWLERIFILEGGKTEISSPLFL